MNNYFHGVINMYKILSALSLIFLVSCGSGSASLEGSYSLDLKNSQTIIDAEKNIKQLELVRDRGREADAQARYERRLKTAKDTLELYKVTFDSINIDNNDIFKWDNRSCKVIEIDVPKGVKCKRGSRERLLDDIVKTDRSDFADMQIHKIKNGLKVIDRSGAEFNFVKN